MAYLYELAVLGDPTPEQLADTETSVSEAIAPFGLRLREEVAWHICPTEFVPEQAKSSAAVYFGTANVSVGNLSDFLRKSIPILPVVASLSHVSATIPDQLRKFNCLAYSDGGSRRVATALLECVGLLPKQRRVFISYRRDEARGAALQLFDELSAKLFDVFLDTHGIALAEDFQTLLWHRLCDSDVLLMLDTPNYFESRWTNAEFGRALAKGISVLRVGWPDSTPSSRTGTASRVELLEAEVDADTGRLSEEAVERIWLQLELVRSHSCAVRNLNLVSGLRHAIETIGGSVAGVGMHKAVYIHLPDDKDVVVYPTLGVPTSTHLHDAATYEPHSSVAVVYDHVGLHPKWLNHLDWLGEQISSVRWVKATEAAWDFADWEVTAR